MALLSGPLFGSATAFDEAAWSALYCTRSRPFDPPKTGRIAVKVINPYGDEVLKVYKVQGGNALAVRRVSGARQRAWPSAGGLGDLGLLHSQLYPDGVLNLAHIFVRKSATTEKEARLANGGQLVRHGLTLLTFEDHHCLAGIEAVRPAGERDNLNSIKEPIRCIVTDDHCRPPLFDFPADGGVKVHPPYLTPFHGLCP